MFYVPDGIGDAEDFPLAAGFTGSLVLGTGGEFYFYYRVVSYLAGFGFYLAVVQGLLHQVQSFDLAAFKFIGHFTAALFDIGVQLGAGIHPYLDRVFIGID